MKNSVKKVALFCGIACIVMGSLLADAVQEEERVACGTREATQIEKIQLREARIKHMQEEKEEGTYGEEEMQSRSVDLAEKGSLWRSYSGAMHWVNVVGDYVEIEDGSQFLISSWDAWRTLGWYPTDVVVIAPNSNYYSIYDYEMHNLTTLDVVECDLLSGPYYYSPYRLEIVGIDYLLDEVILSDGTLWDISLWDWDIVNSWFLGDSIIVGVNDSYINPYILINVNCNNYACASLY